ncbi:universal stress protein [Gottfriedia solisilvae]|uniref:Universal stress protein YxiE n=1 Tax=Gottfriedia solisilvae TaxID=1516104 RepID=A0A8J3EXA7_9BACI|nr:universal stress protein [Gottfriedia solisilvae]GGI12649.1 universal stress protein YxiE [Gottfriedia solisilvae]
MYERFLVPVDGSEHSKHALKSAKRLAQNMGINARITLLHIIPSNNINTVAFGVDIDIEQLQVEEVRRILDESAQVLSGSSIQYDSEYHIGDPAEMICKKAKEGDYDIIVMGSRGLSLFSELLLGSVSHKVVQHANCAVMIVK